MNAALGNIGKTVTALRKRRDRDVAERETARQRALDVVGGKQALVVDAGKLVAIFIDDANAPAGHVARQARDMLGSFAQHRLLAAALGKRHQIELRQAPAVQHVQGGGGTLQRRDIDLRAYDPARQARGVDGDDFASSRADF